MYKEAFTNFTDSHLVALGFVLFMGVFLGALIWTLGVQKKSFYEKLSQMPLEKGE
jgi:cbb3-type cytochrome oxidase subunit 3